MADSVTDGVYKDCKDGHYDGLVTKIVRMVLSMVRMVRTTTFKNRRPIFRNSCNWERDTLDVKEVLGRTQVSEEVSRAETDRGGTSWVLYLCWSKFLLEKNKTCLSIPLVVDIL